MSMEQFSPGPWTAAPFSGVVGCPIMSAVVPGKGTMVIGSSHNGRSVDEVKANARLLAASWEMMKLLNVIVGNNRCETDSECEKALCQVLEAMRDAKKLLARVEGREVQT